MIIIFLYIIAYKNHIQSFNDVDTLAREIDEPGLTQHKIEEMLKQIDGSILTENKYIGHSQYTDFKRAIKGNHKNPAPLKTYPKTSYCKRVKKKNEKKRRKKKQQHRHWPAR